MPNYVINKISSGHFAALWELRDFNNIIPMPLLLQDAESGSASYLFESLSAKGLSIAEIAQQVPFFSTPDKWKRTVKRYHYSKKVYGYLTWYEWALVNWGTKWNALNFSASPGIGEIEFQTAWSHPLPVIEALSRKYPDALLHVQYADEDIGYNVGQYSVKDGCFSDVYKVPDGSKEAFEIAFELYGCGDDYQWCTERQTYIYIAH